MSINANLTPYILYSARQNDFSGIALAIDHTAISTFSNRLVDPQTLHNAPIRQAQIEGLPLKVYLYANSWLAENTQFALLLGVVCCGLLAGLLCYYVLTIKSDPRKSILLGIKNNQFYIVYQPVVNAQTLRISGVEVLMRWRHPVVGEIPPDVFINLAETQQMIVPLNPSPARADRQRRCGVEAYSAARREAGAEYFPCPSAGRQLPRRYAALRRRTASRPLSRGAGGNRAGDD